MSLLIKDTTKEERIEIVKRSMEYCDDPDSIDAMDIYEDYIEGRKELREINESQCSEHYVVAVPERAPRAGCGMAR